MTKPKKTPAPAAKKKTRTKAELLALTKSLGSRVLWALKFLDTKHGGLVANANGGEMQLWEDWFMDALDGTGYVINRKSYYEGKAGKKRKGKKGG
jgi:hypothetical protein